MQISEIEIAKARIQHHSNSPQNEPQNEIKSQLNLF